MPLQIGVIRSTGVGQLGLAVCALEANNVGQHGRITGWIVYGPLYHVKKTSMSSRNVVPK